MPEEKSRPVIGEADAALNKLIAELAKITDQARRKEFYEAHPELRRIYSPVNFH